MFRNQTVIISGGIGDIGFATAKKFAALGADIALGDIKTEAECNDAIAEIEGHGVRCLYTTVDIADPQQTEDWVKRVTETLSAPSLIIANAGVTRLAGFQDISAEQWIRDMNVNLNGAFFLTKSTTQQLVSLGLPGRVVFVGSWAATHVHSHMPAYSVSKAAVSMLNRCLALELAPQNILVNEIAPGYVDAGLSGQIWEAHPGRKEKASARVPTKQVIAAEEVAEKIIFLCDPTNRHMVGTTLLMDGGLSLQ